MSDKWTLHIEEIDYLDGIQSGLTVKADNGAPVAYMFDHKRAVLAAAAPDLLEMAIWAEAALAPFSKDPAEKSGIARLRAAIAKATTP